MNQLLSRKNGFCIMNLALALAAFAGCNANVAPVDTVSVPTPLSLASPVQIGATNATATGNLAVTIVGGVGPAHVTEMLPLTVASVSLETTGSWAGVTALQVPIGDLTVASSAMPPTGLALRDVGVALHSVTPVTALVTTSTDDVLDVSMTTPMAINWKLALPNGTLQPLGALVTTPLTITTDAVRDNDGNIQLHVHGECPGTCGQINGILAIEDATLDLTVPATAVAMAE